MNHEKNAHKYYLENGIFGAYETAEVDFDEEQDGKYAPCFDDSLIIFDSDFNRVTRRMMVSGKSFRVSSIFPVAGMSTPTERMLRLIDSDLEKESMQG